MLPYSPLVSVCIPCYKNPVLLERCLLTVLEQSYSNIEIIITDDSPNNEVSDVIKKYAADKRIQYTKNFPSLGSPENWNAALRLAQGQYVKIMHHDDWFTNSDALKNFVDTALSTNADFICSNCFNVRPDKKQKHFIPEKFKDRWKTNSSLILYANYIGNPSTTFFKLTAGVKNILFDINTMWFVDVLFYYEYTQKNKKIVFIKDFLIDTSAGLDTQVTNSAISGKTVLTEFIYMAEKHKLFAKNNFLTKLSLIEILVRYKIKSKEQIEEITGAPLPENLPYYLLKLPIHHQFYNVFKHFIILF